MAIQFSRIREDALIGLDLRTPENRTPAGYLREALNAEIVQGLARKRVGYASHAGNMPVRVVSTRYIYSATPGERKICFSLEADVNNAAIDLLNTRSCPLVVYGRLSANIGAAPFTTTDAAKYYASWFQEIRNPWLYVVDINNNALPQTLTIAGVTHGLGTADLFVEVAESLSTSSLDNQLIERDSVTIDEVTADIDIEYVNDTGNDKQVFVYLSNQEAAAGFSYVSPPVNVGSGGEATTTITAATHQLENFNIVARVYKDNGSTRELVTPEYFSLDPITGEVNWTIKNNTASAADYFIILAASPSTNQKQGGITGSTYTITLENATSPFIFPMVYVTAGGLLEQVLPDEIQYDSASNSISVTFENPGSNAFTIYWIDGQVRSTEVCVYDTTVTASGVDPRPQLTIWGLDHTEIYARTAPQRSGWVNHIDSYRVAGDNRVVAGLGGVLYAAREQSEVGVSHLVPYAYPDLFARVASPHVLAAPFWETGETPERTRGYVTGDGLLDGAATCDSVNWDSNTEWVRYSMTIPNLQMFTSSGGPETDINNIFTAGDQLTVDSMSYSVHNGVFTIEQVQRTGDLLEIWVENPGVDSDDWDDVDCAGNVRVTSDSVTLQTASPFLPGDDIIGDALLPSINLTCVSSDGTELRVEGVTDRIILQTGVQITGVRSSDVIPLRDVEDVESAAGFLRGDVLTYSGIPNRPLRILYVNPLADITDCSITGDGELATLVLGSGDTEHLSNGMRVILRNAGVYTGTITIDTVLDQTSFTFVSPHTGSEPAVLLQGHTIHIGEEIEWRDTVSDSTSFTVARRMIPVEAPNDMYSLTPSTYPVHFSANVATEQLPLRSTMINDNLYLTNGVDSVMKFDGVNIYRAGLPRWQPGVFIQTDTSANAISDITESTVNILAATTAAEYTKGSCQIDKKDLDAIPVGKEVLVVQGSLREFRVIDSYRTSEAGPTVYYINFTKGLSTFTGLTAATASVVSLYRYYYKLYAVDANGNIVVSAVAQSQDYSVYVTKPTGIRHKLIGLPAWDNYDFDRIYLQTFRTRNLDDSGATTPTFYQLPVQTLVPLNLADGYIEFVDSFNDTNLTDITLDSTGFLGSALSVNLEEPPRAKYITSASNSLVLANLTDYPQLDVQFFGNTSIAPSFPGFNGTLLEFRRDLTDTTGTTDMVNRVRYQFVDGSSYTTISGVSGISGTASSHFIVTTSGNHGRSAGDWIYLYWHTANTPDQSNRPLTYVGWWQIQQVLSPTQFRVNYTGSGSGVPAAYPTRYVVATDARDVPVLNGHPDINPDGNNASANASANTPLFQAGRRLATAINASMRMVDVTLTPTFTPWITAIGGNDAAAPGRVLVRQTRLEESSLGMRVVTLGTGYSLFVNQTAYGAGAVVSNDQKPMPSRLVFSYANYPEMFDAPFSDLELDSDSAIDVNPSDGQEITGVIPLFGEAAFGAAQQSGVLVVFKTESIYLVDINEKRNPRTGQVVQRIETEGVGCTAPGSIAVTKGGVMFANQGGIYRLGRDLRVEYIGSPVERKWLRGLNRDKLDLVTGHHYSTGKQYKLSIPVVESEYSGNSEVLVMDHSGESEQFPAGWTRYDNHPVTGWCNLGHDSYFGTTTGLVCVLRDSGENWDYQDLNQPYTFRVQYRSNDFGILGARKVFGEIYVVYRSEYSSNTSVASAIDTSTNFIPVTGVRIRSYREGLTGIGDMFQQDTVTIQHSLSTRKGTSLGIQIENGNIREAVEVASIEYRVGIYGDGQGVKQASETQG